MPSWAYSIAHKPHTDASELIGWHYDHTSGTSVKGINFLTTLYCADGASLPVAFALVEKDEEFTDSKTGQTKRRATISKNTHYQTMLKACVKNGLPFRYVLNDVWYVAADNMKLIKTELKKDFVMPLKSNRNVTLSGQDKKDGCFQAVQTLALEHGKAREVYLEQVPFPLLLVKQVFTNKDGSQGVLYLVASDTALDGDQIMHLYQERWRVEEYHTKCIAAMFSHTHEDDPEQPRLFVFVRLRQVRDLEDQDPVRPLCAQAESLCGGFASRFCSVADASAQQLARPNLCVTSVNKETIVHRMTPATTQRHAHHFIYLHQ